MKSQRLKNLLLLTAFSIYSGNGLLAQNPPELTDRGGQTDASAVETKTKPNQATRFIRLQRDASGSPVALQTSITRYQDKTGKTLVDLVGAVHIGEADYYKRLNQQFTQYDVVLYELVAPEGTRIPQGGRTDSSNPLSWLQASMKNMLGLESQLELIDYQSKNLKHADLSPKQMATRMAERGDTPITVGLSAVADILRQQNLAQRQAASETDSAPVASLPELMDLLGQPLELKKMLAAQFTDSGDLSNKLGATLNQLLIVDRNQAAVQVLEESIRDGKQKIAIFYGAAHLPDFEQRLTKKLALKKTDHIWVDAWDLTTAPRSNQLSDPASALLKLMELIDN